MDPGRGNKRHRKILASVKEVHTNYISLVILFLLLGGLVYLVSQSSITGQSYAYSEEEAIENFPILQANLSVCTSNRQQLFTDLENTVAEAAEATARYEVIQEEVEKLKLNCEDEKKILEKEYNDKIVKTEAAVKEKENELTELEADFQESYKSLAESSARSICCKQKVDTPGINGFTIEGNAIRCSTTENNLQC